MTIEGTRRVGGPPSLGRVGDDIARSIGYSLAVKLITSLPQAGAREYRRCLYVPKRLTEGHWLIARIGPKAAARMVNDFGGMILQPGSAPSATTELKRQVVTELMKGRTIPEIAAALLIAPALVASLLPQD